MVFAVRGADSVVGIHRRLTRTGEPKRFSRSWLAWNGTRNPSVKSFARASFTARSETAKLSATQEDLQYPPETHLRSRK